MIQKQHKDSKELLEERHIQGFDFSVYMTAPIEDDETIENITTKANNCGSELVGEEMNNMRAFGGIKDGQ